MIENLKANLIPNDIHAFFKNREIDPAKNSKLLDFSFSKNQTKEKTIRNRRLAAHCLKCDEKDVCFVNQTHSSKVLLVTASSDQLVGNADAMVTKRSDKSLAILTADCAPLIFFDPIAKVIGAAHAGWRGALLGISENTVDAMITLGATKKNILVAIGPCISKKNYEVGEDLRVKMLLASRANKKYFFQKSGGKYLFDLSAFLIGRLKRHGVKNVEALNICTYQEKSNFHSYRHAVHERYPNHRRNISIIKL